ncbi:MAG: hypothetical protein ACHQJ6_00240 [Candidatus Berkiellales bacterium]
MDISIFWARLLGLYAVIIPIGMYFQIKTYQTIMLLIGKNPVELMIMGIFTLFLGLAILVSHQKWRGWPIIVTLLGYWITLKGIILSFSPVLVDLAMKFGTKNICYSLLPAFIIGLILLYFGFAHSKN